MSEYRVVNNSLSGSHIEGSAIQAASFRDVHVSGPSKTVNNVIRGARKLDVLATLYRVLASLAGLAAFAAVNSGRTPLQAVATACDALGLPARWAASTAIWIGERPELVGGAAEILLILALLTLPRRKDLGWDLGQTMEWRGPSTAVLSFALLVQGGSMWRGLLLVGLFAAFGACLLSRSTYRAERAEHMMVAVVSIFLAVIFAPLLVLAWMLGRDQIGRAHV